MDICFGMEPPITWTKLLQMVCSHDIQRNFSDSPKWYLLIFID